MFLATNVKAKSIRYLVKITELVESRYNRRRRIHTTEREFTFTFKTFKTGFIFCYILQYHLLADYINFELVLLQFIGLSDLAHF